MKPLVSVRWTYSLPTVHQQYLSSPSPWHCVYWKPPFSVSLPGWQAGHSSTEGKITPTIKPEHNNNLLKNNRGRCTVAAQSKSSFMLVLCSRQIPAKANKLILSSYLILYRWKGNLLAILLTYVCSNLSDCNLFWHEEKSLRNSSVKRTKWPKGWMPKTKRWQQQTDKTRQDKTSKQMQRK